MARSPWQRGERRLARCARRRVCCCCAAHVTLEKVCVRQLQHPTLLYVRGFSCWMHASPRAGAHGWIIPIFNCPLDHLLDPLLLSSAHNMREYSILGNPRTPAHVTSSVVQITLGEGDSAEEFDRLRNMCHRSLTTAAHSTAQNLHPHADIATIATAATTVTPTNPPQRECPPQRPPHSYPDPDADVHLHDQPQPQPLPLNGCQLVRRGSSRDATQRTPARAHGQLGIRQQPIPIPNPPSPYSKAATPFPN